MRALIPLEITDARLTSSTVAEPGVGETTWTSGATFAAQDRAILGSPTSTVTMTIASPCVVSWASNGLPNGTPVVFTTTGALPTGLTASTIYYVVNRAAGTFQVAATPGGAAIVTTGSQSGTHTATAFVHRVYESLVAANTGNHPAIDDGTKWIDVGPTSRWAMFDLDRNTATTGPSPLTVVITPGVRVDAIALVGLVADSVTITVTSGGPTVYTATIDLNRREVLDWYDYFFATFATAPSLARFDIPPYTNAIFTITATRSSGSASIGGVVLGTSVYMGEAEATAQSGALNFSTIARDDYGNSVLTRRRSVPKINARLYSDKSLVNRLRDLRAATNAVPTLWSLLEDDDEDYFEAGLILGIYKAFEIGLDHPETVITNLELEEV